ncbi:hypothetical protein G5714_020366 [Onychostoma macrolepis]|uniref:Uncharacterized protein n=1 Tax=Onychostoma macrolepis TaxID=369639 RepID=A0A7J6BTM5_9TELE|nr:hypothetical protein G5714_020366 [Onychostoma macrolepis]
MKRNKLLNRCEEREAKKKQLLLEVEWWLHEHDNEAERGKPLSVPRAYSTSLTTKKPLSVPRAYSTSLTMKEATVCPTSLFDESYDEEATVCPTSLYNVPSDERSPCLSHEQPREEYTYQEHGNSTYQHPSPLSSLKPQPRPSPCFYPF